MQERDPRPRELSDAEIQQHTWRLGQCRRCHFTGMLRDGVCGTCDTA